MLSQRSIVRRCFQQELAVVVLAASAKTFERNTWSQRKRPANPPAVLEIIYRTKRDQTAAVIHCCSLAFGAAPT